MPKKLETASEHASDKAHSPMKDRARKPGQGGASYDQGNREKKDREMKSGGKNPFDDFGKSTGGGGNSTNSDDNVFSDIKKMSGGKKSKGGCFPKFMMLLLSIVAGVAYVFLGS